MNENDITRQLHSDSRLREAVSRREQRLPAMSADLNDRLMHRIVEQEPKPKPRRTWLYAVVGIAATVLLLLSLHYIYNKVEPELQPVAQQTEQRTSTEKEKTSLRDVSAAVGEASVVAQSTPAKVRAAMVALQTTKRPYSHASTLPYDQAAEDLAACIARLEAEMESIDDSVSAARLDQLIAADARLQQLVFRIVGKQTAQALNEMEKDSTANYINF